MIKCREATVDDPKAKHYVNILLSSVEYDTFVKLMRIMRPVAQQRLILKAESKDEVKKSDSSVAKNGSSSLSSNQPVSLKASAKEIDTPKASESKFQADEKIGSNNDSKINQSK
jgi:hypothetical protein